jgi:chemotaxis signal transduction protein
MEMRPSSEFNGIVFRLEGALFAIEAIRVREILGGVDLQPLYVSGQSQGFLQSRGRTLPVADLRTVFNLPPTRREGPNSFIAVQTGEPGKIVALWVDAVMEMAAIPQAELKPLTTAVADMPSGFLSSMFIRGDEAVYLLNLDRVLSSPGGLGGEKQELKNLAG